MNPNFIFVIENLNIQDQGSKTSYKFSKISFTFSTSDILRNKFNLKKISILGGKSNIFIEEDTKQEKFWENQKITKFLSIIQEIESIEIKNYVLSVSNKNKNKKFYIDLLSLKFPYYLRNYHKKTNIKVDGKWNEANIQASLNFSINKNEIKKKTLFFRFQSRNLFFFLSKK